MNIERELIIISDQESDRLKSILVLCKKWVYKLFPKILGAPYGKSRMTAIMMRSTIIVALALTVILIVNGLFTEDIKFTRILVGSLVIIYLVIGEKMVYRKKYLTAAWMLIVLYLFISSLILLVWSLNTSVAILSIGFTVLLAGILLGTKYIFAVTCTIVGILFAIQLIHSIGIIIPDLSGLEKKPQFMDAFAFTTIISIFALISWLSGRQTEHLIKRAIDAEEKIKQEKLNLIHKLNEQSITLRQIQLQEMANLYKFAEIGQSTTATLHELSNQLSIVSLDIDDLRIRHRQSKAIQNAKEGISNINSLIRQTRKRLNETSSITRFNCVPIIERAIKELNYKFHDKGVHLHKDFHSRNSFQIKGDPLNLSHVLTILLKNAFDATIASDKPLIKVSVSQTSSKIIISISDNGLGINNDDMKKLFYPHKSLKPNGLGIGLYITKHLVETHFNGKISVISSILETTFTVTLPLYDKTL